MSQQLYLPPSMRIEQSRLGRGVPAYLILPREQDQPLPAVVLLHGITHSKNEMYNHALRLAQVGFIACGIDAWGHGERQHNPFPTDRTQKADFLLRVFQETGPDVVSVLEDLAGRSEVRADALGLIGVSMGGAILHYVLTCTRRVRAAVTLISSAEWDWIERDASDPALRRFAQESAPLLHVERYPPVALLLLNAGQDESIPLESAQRTYDRLRPAYADRPELLRFEVFPEARHRVTVEMTRRAIDWLQKHL